VALQPVSAPAQLVIDRLDLAVTPVVGRRVAASIGVTNSSAVPVQAMITRGDWDRDETGDNRFLPPGTTGRSCGDILRITPITLRLDAGSTDSVRVIVNGTPVDRKECWDIIFIEQRIAQSPEKGSALIYQFRTGVKVYVVPPGLIRDGAVESMRVEDAARLATAIAGERPTRDASRAVVVDFRNTGGVHLLAKGSIEVRRPDNTVVTELPIAEFPTLPGALRRIRVTIPSDLPADRYVLLALIDFGGEEIAAGQLELDAR
jgi:P pilus assembly chaperone PapD